MTRPSFTTKHKAIAEHWDGRRFPGTDACGPPAEEPECFACGWSHWFHRGCGEHGCFDHLQRAHVVPRARSGGDEPANLSLLCASCHRAAPDTTDPLWFWRWVANRPSYFQMRFDAMLSLARPEVEALAAMDLNPSDILLYLQQALRRVGVGAHVGEVVDASRARIVVEMLAVARADLRRGEQPGLDLRL